MSWITTVWTMTAAVALTLGAIHALVWIRHPKSRANVVVSILALATAVSSVLDLWMMHVETVASLVTLRGWAQVPLTISFVTLAVFIQWYFRPQRRWPLKALLGLLLVVAVLDLSAWGGWRGGLLSELPVARLWGEDFRVPLGTAGIRALLDQVDVFAVAVFVATAALGLWRRAEGEDQRKALVIGGSVVMCLLFMMVNGVLIHTGMIRMPYIIGPPFMLVLTAVGSEMSRDVIRASRLSNELRRNSESMSLAAEAAGLALWRYDMDGDQLWISAGGSQLYGLPENPTVNPGRVFHAIHPDDRENSRHAVTRALAGGGAFQVEHRVDLPANGSRWLGVRGEIEFQEDQLATCIRGVSIDITERKNAEAEAARHRAELAHLSRVSTLSELSGSLAHELNQPLAIILSNSQAAQRMLGQKEPDLAEVKEILTDIIREDRRAGMVIKRLRTLMKRGETEFVLLSLNEVIVEIMQLTHADLLSRGVTVIRDLPEGVAAVWGDRVQLQQIILNLILNGADAMAGNAPGTRHLHVSTAMEGSSVRLSVRDAGHGLAEDVEQLFAPFHTTKPHGLGMGLAICRSIAAAHRGSLIASSPPEGGALFVLELPTVPVDGQVTRAADVEFGFGNVP
ncbi:MAG: ATP-binding protein [Luteolibacter sp.]